MKAQCPKLGKAVAAAVVDTTVNFGCIEVVPNGGAKPAQRQAGKRGEGCEEGWERPKRSAAPRPMPTTTNVGDYMQPSVFTQAARAEKSEARLTRLKAEGSAQSRWARKGPLVKSIEDSDSEDWVKDFELKYGDCCRVPTKEKHAVNKSPISSKAAVSKVCHLAPLEVVYPEGAELLATGTEDRKPPKYTKLKVALDSGAGAHVINRRDAPGYRVPPSAMSKAGAAFLAADGGRIPNYGEVRVNMISLDSNGASHRITSRFEAADVTRALWSVGLICDSGLDVQFSSEKALVKDKGGNEVCVFHRENGLYVAVVQVEGPENPEGFQRPGQ